MVKTTQAAIKKANSVKPIEFYKPIKDINGIETKKYYITDQCHVYKQEDLDNCNYLSEIEPVKVRDVNSRLCAKMPYDVDTYKIQSLPRVLLRTFDDSTQFTDEFFKNHQANHINPERPLDNSIYNLEWVTPEENMYKAGETGVMVKKYDKSIAHKICQMTCEGKTRLQIRQELGVNGQFIDDVRAGRSHKSVSCQYLDKGFKYKVNDRPEKRERAEEICKLIVEGYRDCEIVKMLDLPNPCVVGDIKHKRAYTYISDKYF